MHEDTRAIVDKCTNMGTKLQRHKYVHIDIIGCVHTSTEHAYMQASGSSHISNSDSYLLQNGQVNGCE